MRKVLTQAVVVVALSLAVASNAWADITVDAPDAAPRCSKIEITLSTDEGHEWTQIHYTGLRLVRGWMHHKGYDQSNTPGWGILGSRVGEWSMTWNGPPTWEFEVIGDENSEAEVWATYIGGSYGEPTRTTAVSKIRVIDGLPRLEVENLEGGSGLNGELIMNGVDHTTIRARVMICDEPVKGVTLTFRTLYGFIGPAPEKWWEDDVLERDYRVEEALGLLTGYEVVTNDEGIAEAILTARSPVDGVGEGARREVVQINDGKPRSNKIAVDGDAMGVQFHETLDVEELPGTNIFKLRERYSEFMETVPAFAFGLSFFAGEDNVLSWLDADEDEPTIRGIATTFWEVGSDAYWGKVMQRATLYFLDKQRASPITAAWLDGLDYAPIKDTTLGHGAVALYEAGGSIHESWVLDPWWTPSYAFARWHDWPGYDAGLEYEVDDDAIYYAAYPATGNEPGTYPWPFRYDDSKPDPDWDALDLVALVTKSPVVPLLTAPDGTRSGVLADGSVVHEIPNSRLLRLDLENGDAKHYLEAGSAEGRLTVRGTADGMFSLTLTRSAGTRQGAAWTGVPIQNGEILTADLAEKSVFVPLVRSSGDEVWPDGSEFFGDVVAKVKVKAPGKDSLKISARWRNSGVGIDTDSDDLTLEFGDQDFTIPAGVAKVSRRGKVTYRAKFEDGSKVRFSYDQRRGKLKFRGTRMDLTGTEPGVFTFGCSCGVRGGVRSAELIRKRKILKTPKR